MDLDTTRTEGDEVVGGTIEGAEEVAAEEVDTPEPVEKPLEEDEELVA